MFKARLSPITTHDDWIDTIYVRDEDGTDFDFTGCTAELVIRKVGTEGVDTVASTTGGEITYPATGYLHWQVLEGDYEFEVGDYDVRLTLERDGFTASLILGTLPVLDGIEA